MIHLSKQPELLEKETECKSLARRIVTLKIDIIISELKNKFLKMKEFYIISAKGFYCGVCDYHYSRFIKKDTLVLSAN